MDHRRLAKAVLRPLVLGLLLPGALLVNAFLVPEPYSHPLIQVALAPTRLMRFLESEGLVRGFTIAIFGRMTPNFAPVTTLVLIGLWFIVGLVGSIVFLKIGRRKDA